MREGKLEFIFSEQRKLTYACLFLCLVFTGIGYAGLLKTASLNSVKSVYLLIMIVLSMFCIYLTIVVPKNKRAISFLLLSGIQLMPALLGSLCIIAVSLGNVTNMNVKTIAFFLSSYVLISVIYCYLMHAHAVWKKNLRQKKYDLKNGLFYPHNLHRKNRNKRRNYKWMGDILLIIIVFSVMLFKLQYFSDGFKFYLIGALSILVSFFFVKIIVNGFFYPLIQIMIWERKNDDEFMICA